MRTRLTPLDWLWVAVSVLSGSGVVLSEQLAGPGSSRPGGILLAGALCAGSRRVVTGDVVYSQVIQDSASLTTVKARDALRIPTEPVAVIGELLVTHHRWPSGNRYVDVFRSVSTPADSRYVRIGYSLVSADLEARARWYVTLITGLLLGVAAGLVTLLFGATLRRDQ